MEDERRHDGEEIDDAPEGQRVFQRLGRACETEGGFDDEKDEGLRKLANLLDPSLFDAFLEKLKDPKEERPIEELVEAWLDGS